MYLKKTLLIKRSITENRYRFNTNSKVSFMLLSYDPDMINNFQNYIKYYIRIKNNIFDFKSQYYNNKKLSCYLIFIRL
mgnify:CR=1 FL=1|jgi:hypothetical protein